MANAILAFGNRADESTLTGGSWLNTLPLENLQDSRIGRVARSSNVLAASSQFDIDLGGPRLIRVVAIANHNISLPGKYRIRLGVDPSFATSDVDSGTQDVWPSVYPFGTVPWGSPSWWGGRLSAEEVEAYTATLVYILTSTVLTRYIRVEIIDTDNADGHIDLGRLFIADGWQPTRNMTYGSGLGWLDRNEVQEALSGAEYVTVRRAARFARFNLPAMVENEGMGNAFEIQRAMGTAGEVLFIWDPTDTTHALRRQFIGRIRTLSFIENPGPDRWSTSFEIKELL